MVTLGVGFVPQLITRGDIRKMHGMQVVILPISILMTKCNLALPKYANVVMLLAAWHRKRLLDWCMLHQLWPVPRGT